MISCHKSAKSVDIGISMIYIIDMKDIKELRKQLNMSQGQFAEYFGIPKHTLQQWEQGLRTPPAYVFSMMKRILELEKKG